MVVELVTMVEEALRVRKLEVLAFIVVPLNKDWPNKVVIGVLVEMITPLGERPGNC